VLAVLDPLHVYAEGFLDTRLKNAAGGSKMQRACLKGFHGDA
jgi:hypothetical protein